MTLALLESIFSPLGELPGFAMPVFELEGVKVAQVISYRASLTHFTPIEIEATGASLTTASPSIALDRGDLAVFAFRTMSGKVLIADQKRMAALLRAQLEEYDEIPDLLHEIANFLQDQKLVVRAYDLITTHAQRGTMSVNTASIHSTLDPKFNYNMFCRFDGVGYLESDLADFKALHNVDAEVLLEPIFREAGALIAVGSGGFDDWSLHEYELVVPDKVTGSTVFAYIQYFTHPYSGSKLLYGIHTDPIYRQPFAISGAWFKLDELHQNPMKCVFVH